MHVFMLDSSSHFDLNLLREIRSQGHSRIPVFHESRDNIIGILLVKNLIGMNPADGHALKDMKLRQPPRLSATRGGSQDSGIISPRELPCRLQVLRRRAQPV